MKEASYEFISLDYQTLEKESIVYDKFGGIVEFDYDWSEKDNCYVINVRQTCNELPIIYKEFIATQTQIDAICTGEILYSDKGISRFTAKEIYETEYKNEKLTLMDFEKVIELFKEKINITISENDRNIDTISLMALPIKQRSCDYEIIPVWAFMGDITFQKGEINKQYPFTIIFNAVTGEEIVI